MQAVPMHVIEANHRGYFFSKEAMRFFKSRLAEYGYKNPNTGITYFVTSEKNGDMPRGYTVRALLPDGSIDSVSAFQEYSNSTTANRHAQKWAQS